MNTLRHTPNIASKAEKPRNTRRALLLGLGAATLLPMLQGCFPVVAAGVTSGVMATVDRRTLGVQTDDETIEWKANAQVSEKVGFSDESYFSKVFKKMTGMTPMNYMKSR